MEIIGIDHGNAAVKTRSFCFSSGVVEYENEPYTHSNVLEYGGRFYVCGSGRQPLMHDKTATKLKTPKRRKISMKKPNNSKLRKAFALWTVFVLALTLFVPTAFAASNDPVTVVNNLSDFIFAIIRAIGLILLGFGILQLGLSLKSHDPSQRANGMLTIAGGIIITFAKEILTLITG